jgi:hypothetical protein
MDTLDFPLDGDESRLGLRSEINLPAGDGGGFGDAVRDEAFDDGIGSCRVSGLSCKARALAIAGPFRDLGRAAMYSSSSFLTNPPAVLP